MKNLKNLSDATWLLIAVCFFLLVGFLYFGFSSDGYYGITGFQTLGQQSFSFWIWNLVIAAVIYVLIRWAIKRYNKTQEGTSVIPFIIAIVIFFSVACIKGCDDKANGGVTSPNGRPEAIK